MKPIHDHDSSNQSCSCMSCFYKSESDKPSLRRFVAHGSRIDKLYYGKYLPLRERKLLERLVRTRAVYDDLRKQILSDSSISFRKPVLKAIENTLSSDRQFNKINRSRDIISLVDTADRGAVISSENLSECCSCCVCGSNISTDEITKRHIHKYKPRYEWRHAYNREYYKPSRRTKMIDTPKHKLGQISEFHKNVHFKTKRVRSEPCTCTYKFRGLMKRASSMIKKNFDQENPTPELKPMSSLEEYKPKVLHATKKSFQKANKSQTCLCKNIEGITKKPTIKEKTSAKMTTELKTIAKRSVEALRHVKYKARKKIEPIQRKKDALISGNEKKLDENAFTIKKDSLTKFREQLRQRRERQDWKCDFECYPDECDPQQCYIILKRKKNRFILDKRPYYSTKIEKKIGDLSFNSAIRIRDDKIENVNKLGKKEQKSKNTQAIKTMDSIPSDDIKEKINTENIKSGIHQPKYAPPLSKMKSRTNVPQVKSKLLTPFVFSGDTNKTVSLGMNKSILKYQTLEKKKRHYTKLAKEEVPIALNRQAVRVGSSFSFDVEFYKNKPIHTLPIVDLSKAILQNNRSKFLTMKNHNIINVKEQFNKSTKMYHKKSGTLYKYQNIKKNTHVSGHPLKRCFCTLQLKAKKTKMHLNGHYKPKSVQTNKLHSVQPISLRHTCKPNICISGKCNPPVCNNRIRKRTIKHRYISTNTDSETKGIATITSKSVSSITSNSNQIHADRTPESILLNTAPATIDVTKIYKPPKQAVRIGSTFSFNVQFSKEYPSSTYSYMNVDNFTTPVKKNFKNLKENNSMNKPKPYIHHKYSHIHNSTIKPRHTINKYDLRKCFCTLKLGRSEKKKKIMSKSSDTSFQSFGQAPKLYHDCKTTGVGTNKKIKKITLELQPYECEPDICVLGKYDPYMCQKLLFTRQPKRLKSHARKLNTESRKTRTTSSLTSATHKLTKTKKVQSAFIAHEVPNYVPRKTVTTSQIVHTPQPNSSSNRQAVKIGSKFSFNIEFYKENPRGVASVVSQRLDRQVTPVINLHQTPKSVKSQTLLKEDGLKKIQLSPKSIQEQVVKNGRVIQIGTAMKRCFCSLSIYKKAKDIKNKEFIDSGTKSPNFTLKTKPNISMVPQNTMTNKNDKYMRHLDPIECEPYVCVPGKCNPYTCLEIIRKKDPRRFSREMGVITKSRNLRSTSRSIQNIIHPTKNVYIQSNIEEQQISKQKQRTLSLQSNLRNVNHEKARQAVNISSKFSFDVEFSKSLPQEQLRLIQKRIKKKVGYKTNIKIDRKGGNQMFSDSRHGSQAIIKKINKGRRVELIKRCFCALKLWKKPETNKNKVSSSVNQRIQPYKVYTVGKITTNNFKYIPRHSFFSLMKNERCTSQEFIVNENIENRINSNREMNRNCNFGIVQNVEISKINNTSFPSVVNPNVIKNENSFMQVQALNRVLYHNKSNRSLRLNYVNSNKLYNQSTKFSKSSNIIKHTDRSINNEIYSKYRLKKVTNNIKLLEHSASPFINQSFYAMNIEVTGQEIPIKNKLEQYECEPGVCTPFECDPLKCQELINKRLLKPVLLTSSTGTNFKSTSNLRSQTISSSIKTRKLQSSKAKKGNKKQLSSNFKNIDIPDNRQVIRVGSSFNFNIEFSKSKSDGQKPKYVPSKNDQKLHKKRRKGRQIEQPKSKQFERRYSTPDDESHSKHIKINHNASNTTPFLERCFCTLKLKKHRNRRSVISTETETFRYPEPEHNYNKFKNMDSTQISKSSKNHKNNYSTKSYECTPGVCFTDQCNTHQCLKLIERRKHTKNVGVESLRSKNISTSSMTRRQKTKMYDKRIKSKSSNSNIKSNKSKNLNVITKPVMQAVHIGSNFSFNVDFFKENSGTLQNSKRKSNTAKSLTKNPPIEQTKGEQQRKTYLKKSKECFPESKKPAFHKTSQTDLIRYVKSTMTNSFINRCFCVARLRREQNINSTFPKKSMNEEQKVEPQNKSSFLKRCFCILKSITTVKEVSKNNPNLQLNTPSQTEANSGIVKDIPRAQKLAPNECEPRICTPGLCDPYVCDRIIKNRKTHHGVTIISNTEKYRTRSVYSSARTPMTVKDKRTQYKTQKANNQQERRSSYTSRSEERKHKNPDSDNISGRQAVRVGSNFSFGVEFYKLEAMGKDDKNNSILATNYKYNANTMAKTNDKIKKSQNKRTRSQKSITYNQKTNASNVKKKNRASGVSHLLQRCLCTLTFQKRHARKTISELSTTNNKTPYLKWTPNMMRLGRNVSDEMKRQEYEPYIPIGDTCNPYKCENRNRKRLQREFSALTDIYKIKPDSNFVTKPLKKENIKAQSKSIHDKQSKLKVTGKITNKKNNKSCKRAIKISSNFGFDIEFFKEKFHEDGLKISKSPKQQNKSRKNNLFNVTPQSFSYKDKKSQHIKRMRHVESQVLEKNVRSTMTGVTPLLKRCFCTLKLQKREMKSPSITRNTIEAGSSVNQNFDLYPKVVAYHKTTRSNKENKYAPFMNLKPYECEPGICIPGKCNPYECIKHINIRKNRMTSRSSITQKTKKIIEYSAKSPHAKSIKSQTFTSEGKNRKKLVQNITSPIVSHPSSNRQAVRVASSFSFDIELFKSRKPTKFYDVPKNPKLSVKNKKKSESITNIKNAKYIKSASDEINYRHRLSHLNSTRTDSMRSGMGPFLKKCLCTLKLQKLGKNSKLQPNILKNTYKETHDVNKIKNFKPYECVPGVCTPGFCDPYECERLIKKRQITELGKLTDCLNLSSTSNTTAKKKEMKSTRTQDQKVERGERKSNIKKPSTKKKSNVIPSPAEATNQRVVSIRSNLNFNIEFFKDRSLKLTRSSPLPQNIKVSKKSKNIDSTSKNNKNSKNRGSQGKGCSYDHGSQAIVTTYTKSKGSKTKLKRCFCTLALQKFSGIPIPDNQFNTVSKPKVKCVEVTTQTKMYHNSTKKYSLQPYECEPGICTPGECNPYDCIKIVQRNTKRRFRATGTQRKQPSQISVSTLTHSNLPKSNTAQTTGIFRKKRTIKSNNSRKTLVKEPHFSFSPNLKNIQTIKMGSNVSFDIEFFKKSTPRKVTINPKDGRKNVLTKHKSIKMGRNSKNIICNNTTCQVINSRCRKSQSEVIKTEDKGSSLGNALKRCFCTAKLHNTPSILNINGTAINEKRGQKDKDCFNRQQYYVYYQLKNSVKNVCPKRCMCTKYNKDLPKFTNSVGTRTKNKYLKLKSSQYAQSKYNLGTRNPGKQTVSEVVTILPFKSNKFLKKTSKAVLMIANGTKKPSSEKCRPICSDNSDLSQRCIKKCKLNAFIGSGVSKKLSDKQIKTALIKDNCTKPPTSRPLKVVVSRSKEKFAIQKYMTQKSDFLENVDHLQFMSQKSKAIKSPFKLDNLKMSKSERHSVDKNRNEPKISKSLKILKLLNYNKPPNVSSPRNKKYSPFQYGDMNQNKTIPAIKFNKTGHSNEYKKYISTNYQIRYDNKLADDKVLKSTTKRRKKVKFSDVTSKSENKVRQVTNLNSLLKKILCKSNTTLDMNNKQPTKIKKGESSPRKTDSKLLGHEKCYNIACYSSEYGRWNDTKNNSVIKIVNIQGDDIMDIRKDNFKFETQELIEDIKRGKEITFPLVITGSSRIREKRKSFGNKQIKEKPRGTTKESKDLKLQVGKQIKGQNYKDSKTNHTMTKNLKSGAKIALSAKITNKKKSCECLISMNKDKEAKILARKMKGKICKCYPSVCECAKVVKIEKERNKKRKAFLKRQFKKVKMEKKRRRRLEKEKKAARRKRRRDFFLRQKRYQVEDALRLHKRRDLNKYLEHRLRTKDTPDYLVATESLLDLAKLSCTVMEDIGRSTYRAMIDPGHTFKRVEATVKKPSRIWTIVKNAIVNSGAPATFKRIILRCKTMSSVKKIRGILERNRCTHYILHIADRDPRKRLKMKKAQERLKRQRVPLDFQCSLYMASLRKKPCLKVYFKCPWFYPHFLNMLGVLRQLADILLFILAAVVWSPCILGMELCRAMMCCLLCTG